MATDGLGGGGLRCAPDLIVVRTSSGWLATPLVGMDPVELSHALVVDLMRSSAGADLDVDPGQAAPLVAAGVVVAAEDGGATSWPEGGSTTSADQVDRLDADVWVWPVVAVVGRISSGALVVEGRSSTLRLDPVDVLVLDVVVELGASSAATVAEAVRERIGGASPDLDELLARIARLVAAGKVQRARADDEARDVEGEAAGAEVPPPMTTPGGESDAPGEDRQVAGRRPLLGSVRARWRRAAGGRDVGPESGGSPTAVEDGPAEPEGPADRDASPVVADEPVAAAEEEGSLYLESPRVGPPIPGRTVVYALMQEDFGPALSMGMITASARHHDGGRLNERYEIRRVEDVTSILADVAERPGPAMLLCSNYVWSVEQNLEAARAVVAANPETVVVHGGPSTPKYEEDRQRFFEQHRAEVHVTVRDEGEHTLPAVLEALEGGLPALELERLDGVAGISYRDPRTGQVVSTEDRDRIVDLDALPSPYLTGEFDHLAERAFPHSFIFESVRGCPYGCTFCDWGSATRSRMRMFDLDRVREEMRWASERNIQVWIPADANTGIMARDVTLAEIMADLRRTYGAPTTLGFTVAKNTTKHLIPIMERLTEARITPSTTLSLQSTDAGTLAAIRRNNIHNEHYMALAAAFRRHGLPVQAELMIGLPGQTVESFSDDNQYLMEHEVKVRSWITALLPNAPMNAPEYRAQWEIVADENNIVRSTSTFDEADWLRMKQLRRAMAVFDGIGLLRHVSRHLFWDHGVPMIDLFRAAIEVSERMPADYPALAWALRYFDLITVPPYSWRQFYADVQRLIVDEVGIPWATDLQVALDVQQFLMPDIGRRFPDSIELEHDFVAYHRAATAPLWIDGLFTPPERPLSSFGPGRLTITGDPLNRCEEGFELQVDPRNDTNADPFWFNTHFELDSPLVKNNPQVAGHGGFVGLREQREHLVPPDLDEAALIGAAEPSIDPDGDVTSVELRSGRVAR